MNQADTASARHHLYLLVSKLYLSGLTEDLLPYIPEIPALKLNIPNNYDSDESASEHYRVFAYDIFPYESIYRDQSGLLGGKFTENVRSFYKKGNIVSSVQDDHIGYELAFLAALSQTEADSINNNDAASTRNFEQLQRSFLQDHLLTWVFPFVNALTLSTSTFYAALGQFTLEILYDHWTTLSDPDSHQPQQLLGERIGPQLDNLLADEQTNLRRITNFLITPPSSGIYFGRETIANLARADHLPRGFGSRQQMMSNLFHSASQYELIPQLLQDLEQHCNRWVGLYDKQHKSFPKFRLFIDQWRYTAANTTSDLSTMHELTITSMLSS